MNTHTTRYFVKFVVPLTVFAFVAASCVAGEIAKIDGFFLGVDMNGHGKKFALVCVPTRKVFEGSSLADGSSQKLLENIAKDSNDLRGALIGEKVFARMGIHLGRRGDWKDGLLIVLLPRKQTPFVLDDEEHTLEAFTPGALTALKDIESAFCPPTEKERFEGELWAKLGFDGLVCWWQDVGVAVTKDGALTHVLLRAAPTTVAAIKPASAP